MPHFIATNNGYYVFGMNDYYQLGLGHNNRIRSPTKLEFEHEIYSVISKGEHTFFFTSNGVYCCGANHMGKLGINGYDVIKQMTKINFEHEIYSIVAGFNHTFFFTSDGIYCCGCNYRGQLGLGDDYPPFVNKPTKFNFEHDIYSITCGINYTLFVTSDGMYACGYSEEGYTCVDHNRDIKTPTKIDFGQNVVLLNNKFNSTKSARFTNN